MATKTYKLTADGHISADYIDNQEVVALKENEIHFYTVDEEEIQKTPSHVDWDAEAVAKGGYEHFMLKEIYDQPRAVRETFEKHMKDGNVEIEDGANIWFGAVLRGDIGKIYVGKNTNIQDNSVIHTDENGNCFIGENVTIGHGAIIHSATISDNTLVGMGATILSNAKIGRDCIIGAQALILENAIFEDGSLIVGVPAKAVRKLTEKEKEGLVENAHLVGEYLMDELDAPPVRLGLRHVPIPFSPPLEHFVAPQVEDIVAAVKKMK